MSDKINNDLQEDFKQIIKTEIKNTSLNKENPTVRDYVDAIKEKMKIAGDIYSASLKQQEQSQGKVTIKDIVFNLSKVDKNMAYKFTREKQIARLVFVPVNSKWIKLVGYDYNNSILYVAFNKASKGGQYDFFRYFGISVSEYASILMKTSDLKKITSRTIGKEIYTSSAKDGFQRLGKYNNAIKNKIEQQSKKEEDYSEEFNFLSSLSYKTKKKLNSRHYKNKNSINGLAFGKISPIVGKANMQELQSFTNYFIEYYDTVNRDVFASREGMNYEDVNFSANDRSRYYEMVKSSSSTLIRNIDMLLNKYGDRMRKISSEILEIVEEYAIKDAYGI